MGIGLGEKWKESKGQSAEMADAAANLDPVVILVMGLLATAAVADNRIAQALRTAANDLFRTRHCPVEG